MSETKGILQLGVNNEGRDFFVGDIHGCLDKFEFALAEVSFNTAVDRIISVGDLVNKGPDSMNCLRLAKQPWFHSVRGNHEYLWIAAMNHDRLDIADNARRDIQWNNHGISLAEMVDSPEIEEEALAILRNTPSALTVDVETDYGKQKIGVIHAEPTREWGEMNKMTCDDFASMSWERGRFRSLHAGYAINHDIEGVDLVVTGHNALDQAARVSNVVCIDQAAFLDGRRLELFTPDQLFNIPQMAEELMLGSAVQP